MRTLTPGAAKRRETTETVRDRMAHLLAMQPPDGTTAAESPPGAPGAPGAPGKSGEPREPGALGQPGDERDGPEPFPLLSEEAPRPAPALRSALALDRRAVLGLAVLLLLALAYAVQHFWLGRPEAVPVPVAATPTTIRAEPGTAASATPEAVAATVVVVDIAGRVQTPGVRALPSGSRVADALRVAGGALPDTDTKQLNLARVLTDGEQILVGEPASQPPPGGPTARSPVSLNHATPEQLDALPGVGPTLAQRIIAFRQTHGLFRSLDQLRQVSGIGQRTFDEMKPLLTL